MLLLAVAALQSLAWDVALPAFQGPDEDTHFAYVQHLAETGEVPSATTGGSAYSSEEEEALVTLNLLPLIGDPNSRPAWSEADLKAWHAVERTINSAGRANGAGPNPIAKNPPLYYAAMSIPYRLFLWLPLLKRLFVMRLFNALCYLATIAMTWLLAGELFGSVRWKQLLAAATVALEPQLSFMSAVINADNLLIALCTAVLLASVRLVTRGPSMARVLTASALTAAAVLTHGRGLVDAARALCRAARGLGEVPTQHGGRAQTRCCRRRDGGRRLPRIRRIRAWRRLAVRRTDNRAELEAELQPAPVRLLDL